ncbi:MAG: SDR family NAD(P)-dependent oxidoreductase [Burkholderiales bacterium]
MAQQRTLLTIGAGPGMGLATAERFASEGWRVVLAAQNQEKVLQLAESLKAKKLQATARRVEAGDAADVAALVKSVHADYGAIDALHYNAASMRQATILDQPPESFASDLTVNIGGALVAIQAVAPLMFQRGEGTILLTGGGYALSPNPDFLSLSIGKAGIRALAQGLFEEFKAKGVHVATVTVAAAVKPGSAEAKAVADHFWAFQTQPRDQWSWEVRYQA